MNYSYEPMRMYDMCSCFFFLVQTEGAAEHGWVVFQPCCSVTTSLSMFPSFIFLPPCFSMRRYRSSHGFVFKGKRM